MRIFYELRYTVIIAIVWTFYLKNVPAKFQKYLKHISWVISRTSSSKLSCNPRHPSRNISCNHRHHLLQPSWRRIFSTSNNQKTRVNSDINSDYKASSFDNLYIRRRKWDTAGFVRARQRKYWNVLTVGRGHADDGCSCNHRAVPPSAHECLLNRLFESRSKKTSKPRVTGLCAGNSPGTGEFPAHMASNEETVSIWWRHYVQEDITWGRFPHYWPFMRGLMTSQRPTNTMLWYFLCYWLGQT